MSERTIEQATARLDAIDSVLTPSEVTEYLLARSDLVDAICRALIKARDGVDACNGTCGDFDNCSFCPRWEALWEQLEAIQ